MAVYRLDDDSCAFPPVEEAVAENDNGTPWIDCQTHTEHLARFGAKDIPRSDYIAMLKSALEV